MCVEVVGIEQDQIATKLLHLNNHQSILGKMQGRKVVMPCIPVMVTLRGSFPGLEREHLFWIRRSLVDYSTTHRKMRTVCDTNLSTQ